MNRRTTFDFDSFTSDLQWSVTLQLATLADVMMVAATVILIVGRVITLSYQGKKEIIGTALLKYAENIEKFKLPMLPIASKMSTFLGKRRASTARAMQRNKKCM